MTAFNSGPSIKLYRKISNWFNFDKNNVLQVYSGKIDIGQHISSTLALISSKITGINYDQVEIIKLNTDICLLYTSPSPRDVEESRMPSSA